MGGNVERHIGDDDRDEALAQVASLTPDDLIDLIGEFGREVYYLLDDCETSGPVGEEIHTITEDGLRKVSAILDRIDALPFEEPGVILGTGAMLQAAIMQTFAHPPQPSVSVSCPAPTPDDETYYSKGKDANWLAALSDEDLAEAVCFAAQDLLSTGSIVRLWWYTLAHVIPASIDPVLPQLDPDLSWAGQ